MTDKKYHGFHENGRIQMYPDGGTVNEDNLDRGAYGSFKKTAKGAKQLTDQARLYAYKQQLDSALNAKNPKVYKELVNGLSDKNFKSKLAYADSLASKNPNFAVNVDEQKKILGNKYNDFDQLRDWRVKQYNAFGNNASVGGGNETSTTNATAYGARNSAFYQPSLYTRNMVQGKQPVADYKAEVQFNPTDSTYKYNYSRTSNGNYTTTYANGGYMQYAQGGIPNAELEKGEPFRTPNGDINQIPNSAPSHNQGGVPMNLPQGTEILGKMVDPYTHKQYKELGDKLNKDYTKYSKVLDEKPTGIARKTAEKMINKIHTKYSDLMQRQEQQKQQEQMAFEYANGGIIPQFAGGGLLSAAYNIGTGIFGSNGKQYDQYSYDANSSSNYNYQDVATPTAYTATSLNASDYYNQNEQQSLTALKGLKYDSNSELAANRTATANNYQNLRNSGLSKGQMLANMRGAQSTESSQNRQTLSNANNANNQYTANYANALNQAGQQKANTNLGVAQYNSNMNYDAYKTNTSNQMQTNQYNASNKMNAYQMNYSNQLSAYNTNMGTSAINEQNKMAKWNAIGTGVGQIDSYMENTKNQAAQVAAMVV